MTPTIKKAIAAVFCALLAAHAGAHAQEAGGAVETVPATDRPADDAVDVAAAPTVVADPAAWGPYARLVGRTFQGETVSGWAGYASTTRSIQWEVPGEVMVETGVQANGEELPAMRISPAGPGELLFDVQRAPNSTGRVADADTLVFDLPFGYENVVRLVDADSYEMKTLKRGEAQAHAIYRDTSSQAHQQRTVERAAEEIAGREAARIALRAAGVPDAPATEAPADRVLAYQEPVRGPSGTLRVTRGKAWTAGACYAAVYINGRWAARLDDAETVRFNVPAGEVQVAVASDPQGRGTCRYGQSTQEVHDTVVGKGEAVHVHFSYGDGQRFSEALVAPAQ